MIGNGRKCEYKLRGVNGHLCGISEVHEYLGNGSYWLTIPVDGNHVFEIQNMSDYQVEECIRYSKNPRHYWRGRFILSLRCNGKFG